MIEWRVVPGYPSYEVSSDGQVRRAAPARNSWPGRVLKQCLRNGYPFVQLCERNVRRSESIHRLVAAAFLGPCPDGWEVNHRNGCKTDNRLDNLEYATSSANQMHAYRAGLQDASGERNGQSKLTEGQVREILAVGSYPYGTYARLAREYGVSPTTIRGIVTGRYWSHVQVA